MEKHLIITTCGTSLLTNDLSDPRDGAVRQLVQRHANHNQAAIPAAERAQLGALAERRRVQLLDATVDNACRMSAELNGILNFYGRQAPLPSPDAHVLIHTDTWLGGLVAEALSEKLRRLGAVPQLHLAQSLNTADLTSFQHGLAGLVDWAADTLPGYRRSQYRVIFNLVGGFKSVQGFMQTLGMFHADEILYIFETGKELLRIPRLPVDLDAAAKQVVADNLQAFRRVNLLGAVPSDSPELKRIPEALLYTLGNETELTPWGKIIWEQARRLLYRQKLHESPVDEIRYADRFRDDAASLSPDRLEILNTRIDDLARHLLSGERANIHRLDLKKLRSDPMPPSNYECDAWAGADCRRIYMTLERGRAILNRVTAALH